MKKSNPSKKLFSEFPAVSRSQWEAQIQKDLNGVNYKEKLTWDTLEDITVLPFYVHDDISEFSIPQSTTPSWKICVPIYSKSPKKANNEIKEAIHGGANSFMISSTILTDKKTGVDKISGAQILNQKDFDIAFKGIDLNLNQIHFDTGMASPAFLALFLNRRLNSESAVFHFDPFTYTAKYGRKPLPDDELTSLIAQMSDTENCLTLCADGLFYHHSGASIVQEMGIVLAIASEYLAIAEENKRTGIVRSLSARISAGPLYFPEIAKVRALRFLWKNLLNAYDLGHTLPLFIHSQTTTQNKTVTAPYNNILRTTSEAMSAIIGGVNSLSITPFDATYNEPTSFSKRIARNIHHITREEAHLGKVEDVAAGSYYIEKLTEEISTKAWDFFKRIEKEGGFTKALKKKIIQNAIGKSKNLKFEAYATRKKILTGTNSFPDPGEDLHLPSVSIQTGNVLTYSYQNVSLDPENLISSFQKHFNSGRTIGDLRKYIINPQKTDYPSIEEVHIAEMFDLIRFRTEQFKKEHDRNIRVTLIPVGNLKWRKARASFAQNLLGCAGFEIENPSGFNSLSDAVNEMSQRQSDIFVLCSSDNEYEQLVSPFCEAFKNKGLLILAGNPGMNRDNYQKSGIDDFIRAGMNVPEFLTRLQQILFEKEEI